MLKPGPWPNMSEFLHARSLGSRSSRPVWDHTTAATCRKLQPNRWRLDAAVVVPLCLPGLLDVPPSARFLPHFRRRPGFLFTSYLLILFALITRFSGPWPWVVWVLACDHILRQREGLFGPKSTHPGVILQTELLQAVNASWKIMCAARLLLGFHKYSGQIVFASHRERCYPSFWMSSVIGIIGTKVQNLTLRVGALHAGRSDEIRKCVLSARLSNMCFLKARLKPSLSIKKCSATNAGFSAEHLSLGSCPGQS